MVEEERRQAAMACAKPASSAFDQLLKGVLALASVCGLHSPLKLRRQTSLAAGLPPQQACGEGLASRCPLADRQPQPESASAVRGKYGDADAAATRDHVAPFEQRPSYSWQRRAMATPARRFDKHCKFGSSESDP